MNRVELIGEGCDWRVIVRADEEGGGGSRRRKRCRLYPCFLDTSLRLASLRRHETIVVAAHGKHGQVERDGALCLHTAGRIRPITKS